jgi:carbamoyltransferase
VHPPDAAAREPADEVASGCAGRGDRQEGDLIVCGLNAFHGDASVALLRDGVLATAVEEERFTRVKHAAGFPSAALREAVLHAAIDPKTIDAFAVSRRPTAHWCRKAAWALRNRPSAAAVRDRVTNAAQVRGIADHIATSLGLDSAQVQRRLTWVEHHQAHLASAFFASPFEAAAVCAIDGFGDFVSTSIASGRGRELRRLDSVFFPHSLGLFYLALTQYLGFPRYGDEYKVMGLAPYGAPEKAAEIRRLIRLERGGRFSLDLGYFRHWSDAIAMTWDGGEPSIADVFTPKLEELLGPRRLPDEEIEPRHEAIAASAQAVFEEAAFHVLAELQRRTGHTRLCLAGGCAMNSVMNGKIRQRTAFEEVYVQPAAADNGTALGAALHVSHQAHGAPRAFVMDHAFWGPEFGEAAVRQALERRRDWLDRCSESVMPSLDELCRWTAARIADAKIVGWFQGRMEWGARALGNRSILADPRRSDMRAIINTRIKFRERFRPFAPSILEEALDEYFVDAVRDPFMIQVYPVRPDKRSVIPAVTHVDGSGRVQTVNRNTNVVFWTLIKAFEQISHVPVLLNTSFNENEPIVRTPDEALDCFLRTDMDVLVLGQHALEKAGAWHHEWPSLPHSKRSSTAAASMAPTGTAS